VLGIDKGRIAVGASADLVVFDPAAPLRITAEGLKSQGKNSPFLGYEFAGRVRCTLVAGQVVFESS
jgi:dihydroorotase